MKRHRAIRLGTALAVILLALEAPLTRSGPCPTQDQLAGAPAPADSTWAPRLAPGDTSAGDAELAGPAAGGPEGQAPASVAASPRAAADDSCQFGPVAALILADDFAAAYRLLASYPDSGATARRCPLREYQRAVCERQLGRADRALAHLERLAGAVPVLDGYRRYWLACCLEDLHRFDEARAVHRHLQAAAGRALRDLSRWRLAELWVRAGRLAAAVEEYEQLRGSTAVADVEVLYRLGQLHGMRGQPREQRRVWLELVRRFPGSARARQILLELPLQDEFAEVHARATALAKHRLHDEAIALWEQFLGAHPQHPSAVEAQYQLATVHASAGSTARAAELFAELWARRRHPEALHSLAGVLVRQDKDSEASRTFEQFARTFPQHRLADDALWRAAKAAEREEDFQRAENLYERLVEACPQSSLRDEAAWCAAFMRYCRGEYREALARFVALAPTAREAHLLDQNLFWAGKAAEKLGMEDQAHSFYQRVAATFPRSYYATRAVALGHGMPPALGGGPGAWRATRPPAVPGAAGRDAVRRADCLAAIGMRQLACRELAVATDRDDADVHTLAAARDRYEAWGLLDLALRLSTRIVAATGSRDIGQLYPAYYWDQTAAAAAAAGLDPHLALAVMRQESSFNPAAVSPAGALGLMQLMPQTAAVLGERLGLGQLSPERLLDPGLSILLGSHYLGEQLRALEAEAGAPLAVELAVAAYNAGPDKVRLWLQRLPAADPEAFVERIPYHETRKYVKLVMRSYTIYKALGDG